MASLSIYVLGSFQVYADQENVTQAFRTRKERALLAHLAVEAGRPHRREALAELLWPERPEGYARTNLRQALLGLRRAIGQEVLTISDELIQFTSDEGFWLDTKAFSSLVQSTLSHPHRNPESCHECAQKMQEAIALYRGDFLEDMLVPEGQSFQEWVVFHREQHFRHLLTAYSFLSNYYQFEGDYELAYKYAWQYVNLAPLEEAAHRQLMNLLTISGRRSAALEQYHACRLLLAKELGVEPSPETTALYEKIKTGVMLDLDPSILNLQLTNLPVQLTSFFGREEEIERLNHCIGSPACRLITLIGMPGVGKTRLTLQVVGNNLQKFPDGVWYVPLDQVNTPEKLASSVAQAIGVPHKDGEDAREQLIHILRPLKTLLVLDQFESLLQETGLLVELLQQAPGLKIIVTSRVRLNYQAACLFEIQGLSFPGFDDITHAVEYPAVQLLLARAQQSHSSLVLNDESMANIIQMCQLVDGLPLALELAAARLRGLSLDSLVRELQSGLDVLTTSLRDLPEHHRSLHAAFDPLVDMLNDQEKLIFEKLSVFVGGFTLEAAEVVAGASLGELSTLVDKSLLNIRLPGKYSLHPLLRIYAAEKLALNPLEQKLAQDRNNIHLSQRAIRDPITSLVNTEVLWDRLEHLLARARRKRQNAALILFDIHLVAEESTNAQALRAQALRAVAECLVNCLRSVDTVARLNGGRFAILLDELTAAEDGLLVVRKIYKAVGKMIEVQGKAFTVDMRVGLSIYPQDGDDLQKLVKNAEAALEQTRQLTFEPFDY